MSLDGVIDEMETLVPGGHLHLDEVLTGHPPPGDRAWMRLLVELADRLAKTDRRWFISLPVGDVDAERAVLATLETVFDLVSEPSIEPPSVHRPHDHLPTPWLGEELSESSEVGAGVIVTTTLSRSLVERVRNEPWNASITFATRRSDDR